MPSWLVSVLGVLSEIAKNFGWMLKVLLIRKAARNEIQNEHAFLKIEEQKRQLEIASRKRSDWNELLERMRSDQL